MSLKPNPYINNLFQLNSQVLCDKMPQLPMINGMQIIVSTPIKVPNYKIPKTVLLSKEYRAKIDQWCLDFFGHTAKETLEDGQIVAYQNKLVVNRATYNHIKNNIPK